MVLVITVNALRVSVACGRQSPTVSTQKTQFCAALSVVASSHVRRGNVAPNTESKTSKVLVLNDDIHTLTLENFSFCEDVSNFDDPSLPFLRY